MYRLDAIEENQIETAADVTSQTSMVVGELAICS